MMRPTPYMLLFLCVPSACACVWHQTNMFLDEGGYMNDMPNRSWGNQQRGNKPGFAGKLAWCGWRQGGCLAGCLTG